MYRFFSLDARIARTRLVAGIVLAMILAWGGILALRTGTPAILVLVGALGGGVFAKLLVESVRRRHDMGRGGAPAIALGGGGVIMMVAASIYALGTGVFEVLYAAGLIIAIAWAFLLLPPGAPKVSRFGAPIRNPLVPTFGEPRAFWGALLAISLIIVGAGLGFVGARWNAGLRERHAVDQQYADSIETSDNRAAPDDLELDYRKSGGR